MTEKQKVDAFAMKLDGYTLQDIGEKYGVTREYIRQMFAYVCTKSGVPRKNYVFPNITDWMEANNVTQTDLAKLLGVGQTTISSYLTGRNDPPMRFVSLVLDKTGMQFETAFKKRSAKDAQ
ncbi:helix-turn-helix domain-containing protein [Oscillibacter sp.]|uniref:helix-turn-helix domain-containing protein n=1 Tax=Oscillibacter sp. TaxID=1945593 RepID=UPI0028A1CC61|nr:helix-turn-helix domain-containing protein [Oscillibacter sp.]